MFLYRRSLKDVEEFNGDTMKIYENCMSPIFMLFINMSPENAKTTESYIAMLNRSAKKYSDFMLFSYANASDEFIKKRKMLVEKAPGAAIAFRDGSIINYPKQWPLDDTNIDKFVELYLRQKLNKSESTTFQPDYSKEMYEDLKAVNLLRSATFNETVLEFGKYVLVFFFRSEVEDDLEYD